jgi:branched-chain amino acid transport system ATP-binding protein
VSGLLEAIGLDVVEGTRWRVREVDLALDAGSVLALLGGPDAGKSAVLAALAGVRPPRGGRVLLDGAVIGGLLAEAIVARGLAWSGQRPSLFADLAVHDHLELGGIHLGRRERRAARIRALDLVPELVPRRRQRARRLGRAERRLLDIARSLAGAPRVLLLDEPAAALGPARVGRLVGELRRQGTAVLLAERLVAPALRMADRGALLQGGRLTVEGDPETLYADSRVHAACLGESVADS